MIIVVDNSKKVLKVLSLVSNVVEVVQDIVKVNEKVEKVVFLDNKTKEEINI